MLRLAAVVAAVALAGSVSEEQARLGFGVEFPAEPKQESLQQTLGGKQVTVNTFTLEEERVVFQVVHTALPYKNPTIGNKAAALDGMVQGYAKKHGAHIDTQRSIKLDGAPGVECEGTVPPEQPDEPHQAFRFRAFVHGSALVGVVTVGFLSEADNDERARLFLESLRLFEPARPGRRSR